MQIVGAALVLVGVMLVTLQPASKRDAGASRRLKPDARAAHRSNRIA